MRKAPQANCGAFRVGTQLFPELQGIPDLFSAWPVSQQEGVRQLHHGLQQPGVLLFPEGGPDKLHVQLQGVDGQLCQHIQGGIAGAACTAMRCDGKQQTLPGHGSSVPDPSSISFVIIRLPQILWLNSIVLYQFLWFNNYVEVVVCMNMSSGNL